MREIKKKNTYSSQPLRKRLFDMRGVGMCGGKKVHDFECFNRVCHRRFRSWRDLKMFSNNRIHYVLRAHCAGKICRLVL
ncbi:hypothetical protein Pan258_33750 [Symmachiella dynata]|nr:hypothetical protein Pan258_33750 [Symmachiella dynata]